MTLFTIMFIDFHHMFSCNYPLIRLGFSHFAPFKKFADFSLIIIIIIIIIIIFYLHHKSDKLYSYIEIYKPRLKSFQ